ncbi:MAG: porin [Nitrosomonadales bacterium]|nr:porin [Nitrosomonadales bacterium]
MQKKILVLAVTAVLAAPAAFADTANVTVYGAVDLAIDMVSNGDTTSANAAAVTAGCPTLGGACSGISNAQVSSQVSKVGLKGAGDMGDGLSAIWQIEQQIDVDNSGATGAKNTFATRNTYAGLKSDSAGTVLLGRYDTPYKTATRKLDVFGDQLADNRSLMGGGTTATGAGYHDARPTDVMAYISPKIADSTTVAVAYVAGAESATNSTQVKGDAWSMAGMYEAGPLYAALGYQVFNFGSTGTGQLAGTRDTQTTAWKLGGGYKMDALQLNAVYEKTSDNLTASTKADKYGRSTWYLAAKYSLGNDAVKVAYTSTGKQAGAAAGTDTSARQLSLGYDRNINKSTTLYVLYTKLTNAADAAYTLTTAGSTAGGVVLLGNGADPSAMSLGVKYAF